MRHRLLLGEELNGLFTLDYPSWQQQVAASPLYFQRYRTYLDQMVAFAEALPGLQPQLTALAVAPLTPQVLPRDLEWDQGGWDRKLAALARLSGLKELRLWGAYYDITPDLGLWSGGQLAALSGLVGLERLQVKVMEADVAQLPPALTALTLVAGFLVDSWDPEGVQASVERQQQAAPGGGGQRTSSRLAGQARPDYQQLNSGRRSRPLPVVRLPQLRQLQFRDVFRDDGGELCFELLSPLLREAEVLEVDTCAAVDWASLALPSSLRELTVPAPWQGCAQQLAPLQRLTSLKFSRRSHTAPNRYTQQELGAAAAAVQRLTQLRRLAVWPLPGPPGMPPQMVQQLKQALPWCTLECAPLECDELDYLDFIMDFDEDEYSE